MRTITTIITFCFFIANTLASDTTITFRAIEYSDAFELSKKEQKPIFLYFHFDGCGACVTMEKTAFVDPEVIDFYNENFICLEVNTMKGEGIETNKIYNVRLHPAFLFVDEDANVLHKVIGIFDPEEFVALAQAALDPTKTLAAYKEQYEQGNREAGFLYDYCYKLRDAYEIDSLVINEYLATQSVEDLGHEKNIRFIYEFAIHQFDITMPFGSPAFSFLRNHKEQFSQHFDADQVDTRIVWIVSNAVHSAIENQDEALFHEALDVLREYDNGEMYMFKEMDGRTTGVITTKDLVLSSQIAYYDQSGDDEMHRKLLSQYIDKNWDDWDALNTMAWNYYEFEDNVVRLEMAKGWVIRSIELKSTYANNDTYAALLYKLGEYDAALKQAEVAISIAREKGMNYRGTSELVEKIRGRE